jgi:MFS family permease
MLLPTLPLYLNDRGGNLQEVGLVIGVFAIGLLCFRPWLGKAADDQGRKPVLLAALGVAATAPVGYLAMKSLPLLIAWRTYHGLAVAGFTIAYLAWVVDLVPPSKRGEIIGYMTLVNPLGLAIGPAMGGFLLELRGYPFLFCSASVLGTLGFCLASTVQEEFSYPFSGSHSAGNSVRNGRAKITESQTIDNIPPQTKIKAQKLRRSLRWLRRFILPLGAQILGFMVLLGSVPIVVNTLGLSAYLVWFFLPFYGLSAVLGLNLHPGSLLWRPGIGVIPLSLLFFGLSFGTVTTFIALFIKTTGFALNPGWFYTIAAIASFSARLIVGRYSDRYGRGVFLSLSFLLYTLAMVQLTQAKTIVAILAAAAFEGAGFGILIAMVAALVADRCAEAERGQIFSICFAGLDVGIATAGPLLGYWVDRQGYPATFQLAALLAALALVIFLFGSNKTFRSSLRFSLGLGPDDYAHNQY